MKILLLGHTGQVGHEIQRQLGNTATLVAPDRATFDLVSPHSIEMQVREIAPDLIINAAAYTGVDQSETDVTLAQQINGAAPGYLAAAAQNVGAAMLHLSTDYVFNGSQSSPYSEADPPSPLGVYGQSKWVGEQSVQAQCDRHIILRTAWVYGSHGPGNFVKTMLKLGRDREVVRVVYDQVGTPTWSRDIANVAITFSQRLESVPWGTYHFTSSGVASWYDFAVAIFEEAAALGYPLKLERVVPITTPEYPTPAARPAYSVLATEKISDFLGRRPVHWRQSLRIMLAEYVPQLLANEG